MNTVYIIEDEEILRNLLATFFETTLPDWKLLGMTGDGNEGITQCLELEPDLVIVDLQLPEVNGLDILHQLKRKSSKIKVLIFSGKTSYQTVKIAIDRKVDGFINKISGLEELEKAIQAIPQGDKFFSPEIHDTVLRIQAEDLRDNETS
jgi:DNA-binding NarL/FixJ family response regulator